MNDLETRTVAPLVTATANRLGTQLPKPVTDAIAAGQQLREAHREGALDAPDLTAAVAAALWAGKDPLTSKDVQRAALAHQLRQASVFDRLDHYARARVAEAIVEHADAIIDTWRPVIAKADDALREFHRLAPDADLADTSLANQLPTHALTPWGRAREASGLLDQVGQGWQAIANAARIPIPHNARPLIVADLTLDQVDELGGRPTCAAVARIDVPLDLANLATFTDRARRLTQAQQDRAQHTATATDRAREQRRQTYGIFVPR